MSSAGSNILIIGAGIAGPVLAMFLKLKGFEPTLFERNASLEDVGISLMLSSNGLKVLRLIPGLVDGPPGSDILGFKTISILQSKTLTSCELPPREQIPIHLRGVPRAEFRAYLIQKAEEAGVKVRWNHQLKDLEQSDDEVTASFTNGAKFSGSLLIGCDGLHSASRTILFGKETPSYTGLTQIGGWSSVPSNFVSDVPRIVQYFADGEHMICYRIGEDMVSWAVTKQEPENRESWNHLDEAEKERIRNGLESQWIGGAGEMIRNAHKMVKYGLYDRPALETWYKGRVVLVGDAAHPTSPHVGQGANQAFEDVYHLMRVLLKNGVTPTTKITLSSLQKSFLEYQEIRRARSSAFVKEARNEGSNIRVVNGIEACQRRDELVRELWKEEVLVQRLGNIAKYPYEGESEIN